MEAHRFDGVEGLFIHPVENDWVMAGNGTIGLELIEDLPDVETVIVPVGGGGLLVGIASAVKALRPSARIVAVQPDTGAPLAESWRRGEAAEIDYTADVDRRRRREGGAAGDVAAAAGGRRRRGRRHARRGRGGRPAPGDTRASDRRGRGSAGAGRRSVRARRRRHRSPASSPAGTSTPPCSAGSSPARRRSSSAAPRDHEGAAAELPAIREPAFVPTCRPDVPAVGPGREQVPAAGVAPASGQL